MSVKTVNLSPILRNFGLPVAILLCLALTVFAIKWYLGNATSANATQKEIAEIAQSLAPNDPQSYYALAVLSENSFLPEDLTKSLEYYEKATSLSPKDYRLWFALGRARDRDGDTDGAEKSYQRALQLAPNYSQIQWALGNLYLRQEKNDQAFSLIKKAVEGDNSYSAPAVSVVSQIVGGDAVEISKKLGDSLNIKSAMANFLAKEKRYDEALKIWNEIPDTDKQTTFKELGKELLNNFLNAKKFRHAQQVQKNLFSDEPSNLEKITDGGFESGIESKSESIFVWKIGAGTQPQIGLNNEQKHSGNQSLFIIFNSPTGKDFRSVSQTVAVESNQSYNFKGFFRSDLKSSATLKWEIVDASDGKVLGSTEAVSANSDWAQFSAKFATNSDTEAVTVQLARVACNTPVCPIAGKIWFDDFELTK